MRSPGSPRRISRRLRKLGKVTLVPLDVTDEGSVTELAGSIGGKVDILVNTAEFHRPNAVSATGIETARAEMEVNYFGLLRLAQAFGPALRARAADGAAQRHRLGEHPLDLCALELSAARHLLGLEGRGLVAGPGAARRAAGAPASASSTSSPGRSTMNGTHLVRRRSSRRKRSPHPSSTRCERGIEDVYPGDVAKDWLARFHEIPKALERELAG